MEKDDLNMHVFQNRNWGPFHRRDFKRKKYGGKGLVSQKREALLAELMEAATISYSATGKFWQYIYCMLVTKNHRKIRSRCLVHEFSFTDIFNNINHGHQAALLKKNSLWLFSFYMDVASYCYYKRCAER